VRPLTLSAGPSPILLLLGGLVGTVLLMALMHLAPAFGFPFIDFPRLVGGLFSSDPDVAFGVGAAVVLLLGWFVFAPLLHPFWVMLPGRSPGLKGALVNGALWGLILWALAGLGAPVLGALNRVPGIESPGLFMMNTGALGVVGTLAGHLAYGVAVTMVASLARGISPLETLGRTGYGRPDLLAPHEPGGWRGPEGKIEATRPVEA
jgi:hypothetical protein